MRRPVIAIFTAIVLVILFIVLCTYVRRPYEKVLLVRFGRIIPQEQQARLMYNLYFKMPTDEVVRVDTRLHLYTGPLVQVATKSKEPISIRTFAVWHITDPEQFYRTMAGSDATAKQIMEAKLQGLVQGNLAQHNLDELFNTDEAKVHTGAIESKVAQDATNGSNDAGVQISGVKDQGLEIVQVGFSRMAFPPANADSVYQRMVAELNQRASDYQAQGIAAAARLNAEAQKEAAETVATARAQAEQIRGEGEQEALKILAAVQQTPAAREFYQFWKSLDFAKNALQKNNIMVLSTDSDLLKYLFRTPGNVQNPPATQPGSLGASAAPAVRQEQPSSAADGTLNAQNR